MVTTLLDMYVFTWYGDVEGACMDQVRYVPANRQAQSS